ncbi:hypothetical protein PIB30_085478 [Stylosanthes scabra]|uniref:Uncharacterized protein n=1 Tax=Stylosanthes scabra TaxID=79078 RepID=A0ABU6ST36_9FABA|nr:hypothetical protein [Stylosanthes scabra]
MNPLNNPVSLKKKLLFNNPNNNLHNLIRMKSLRSLQARTMSNYQATWKSRIHWSLKLKNSKKTNLLRWWSLYPQHRSDSEDERQPLIPKTEEDHVSSPSARIITEVLMSMNRELQRDEAPSFDLGIDPPLLTTQDLSNIEELDELVRKAQDQFQTPQTTKSLENQKDLEEKVVTWAMVPKVDNEFETIFKLLGDRFLEAMRYQFTSMRLRTYIDIQNERFEKFVYCVPPEILVNPVHSPHKILVA